MERTQEKPKVKIEFQKGESVKIKEGPFESFDGIVEARNLTPEIARQLGLPPATAGVVIADRLLGLGWKPLRILDEAARIEGHPDNVSACVLGALASQHG